MEYTIDQIVDRMLTARPCSDEHKQLLRPALLPYAKAVKEMLDEGNKPELLTKEEQANEAFNRG